MLYFDQTVSVFYPLQVFGSQKCGQKDDGYHVIAMDEIRQNPEDDHSCKIDDQDDGRYLAVGISQAKQVVVGVLGVGRKGGAVFPNADDENPERIVQGICHEGNASGNVSFETQGGVRRHQTVFLDKDQGADGARHADHQTARVAHENPCRCPIVVQKSEQVARKGQTQD